jgi:membrane fusion protein (multidrug efflux system)
MWGNSHELWGNAGRMRVSKQLITVAVLASLAAGTWYARDQLPWSDASDQAANGKGRGQRATLVEVAAARRDNVTVIVEAVGTARANEAVTITSKVTGHVSQIHFKEGGRVKTGDILVELDSREMQAALEEKKADRDTAARLYERARKLYESRNVPRARVDDLYGELQSAEARVKAEEARIKEYYIHAPFSGRLGLRRVSVGALINPGAEITTLDDTARIKADFRVPEISLIHIARGQTVTAMSAAYADKDFVGKVTTIDTRVDPVTRSVEVRTIFDNPKELIRPGMFLTAEFVTVVRENSVLIPEQSIVVSGDTQYVFVIVDGRASRRDIVTGQHVEGDIEVVSGLSPEEIVVIGGVQKIRDGAAVKIAKPPEPAAKPGMS